MPLVAETKLSWKKSVSADVVKIQVIYTLDGQTLTVEHGPEVESITVDLAANKSGRFQVKSIDSEGLTSMSAEYSWVNGDLVAPQPAMDLFHEVVAVREVP